MLRVYTQLGPTVIASECQVLWGITSRPHTLNSVDVSPLNFTTTPHYGHLEDISRIIEKNRLWLKNLTSRQDDVTYDWAKVESEWFMRTQSK